MSINSSMPERPFDGKALIDGRIVSYDATHDTKDTNYNPDIYEYIGQGFIYSIHDVIQNFTKQNHFWKKKFNNQQH